MHGKIPLETDRILSVMKAKTFDAPMTSSGTRSEEVVLIKPLSSSLSPRPNQMNQRPLDKSKSFPRGSQSHVLPGLDPWQLVSDPGGSPVFDFWDSVDVCDDLVLVTKTGSKVPELALRIPSTI